MTSPPTPTEVGSAPGPRQPTGTVVVSRHPVGSRAEDEVRRRLLAAGVRLHPGRSALQCGFDEEHGYWPVLTPDFLVRDARVCIEFDPGYTHEHEENADLRRNRLLNDIGWTVVRLRTGGLPALGPYDVTTDTSSSTVASVRGLVESIADAVAGRPGRPRHFTRPPTPERASSRLGSIAADKHLENAFYASWTLDSGETARLRIMAGGHFLGAHGAGWGVPAFILRLGLDRVPRAKWRGQLEDVLAGLSDESLEPVSRFPWGDELFEGELAQATPVDRKFNVGAAAHIGSLTLPDVLTWTAAEIRTAGGASLSLHPGAVDAGWRFADVRQRTGPRGRLQPYLLMRDGERRGLWSTPSPPGK